MFATKFEFDIAKPCTENWNEMTPNEQGRFCSSCQKSVVDLTSKTDRQILQIYEQNEGKLCGRALPKQLNRSFSLEQPYVRKTKLKAFTALIASILGFGHLNAQEVVVTAPKMETKIYSTKCGAALNSTKETTAATIKGKVTDQDTGEGLPFANVILESNGLQLGGTTTDLEGNYSIEYNGDQETVDLRVLYVGYLDHITSGIQTKIQGSQDVFLEVDMVLPSQHMTMGIVITVKRTPAQKIKSLIKRPYYKLRNIIYNNKNSYWYEERKDRRTENKATRAKLKQERKQARQQAPQPEITEIVTVDGFDKRTTPNTDLPVVYPNPFQEALTVNLKSEEQNTSMHLVLFNVNGIELLRKEVTALQGQNNFELDVKGLDLPAGSYFLSIFKEEEMIQTVIVEKITE